MWIPMLSEVTEAMLQYVTETTELTKDLVIALYLKGRLDRKAN